jgi:PAS domain S-box-containing protein
MRDNFEGDAPSADHSKEQVQEFLRRLTHAEGTLESETAGEVDAVVDPATAVPILLTRAQQAFLRSEARHRDLIERCPSLVVELAPDGTTLLANEAARRLLGVRARDLTGRNWWTDVVPGGWREVGETLALKMRRGDVTGRELPLDARDGTLRWIEWTSANRYAPDGELEAVMLFGLDVTERRTAEAAERRLAEERVARAGAEAASRAKSEFLTTMSHELRTPVNAIVGYAQLMEMGLAGPLSEGQRQYLERIKATSAHLTSVVTEVLDLAKVDAGRLAVAPERARAGDAVTVAIALVTPQAAQRGVALGERCTHGAGLTYVGDEARVRQILVNLLSNAVKFTPPGGEVVVDCEVADRPPPGSSLSGAGPWGAIHVRDTGVGIPPDKLTQVFEPFVQLDGGHRRKEGGTGLGLTISRRLARLMGGDLTVESVPDEGSTFTLLLPAGDPVDSSMASVFREQSAAGGARATAQSGLAMIGGRLASHAEDVATAVAERLRCDPATPRARELSDSQLKDHHPTLVTDLATSLVVLAEHGGEPSRVMRDGTDIQRLVAERHGVQRAGLGWTEAAHGREYAILREELEAVARQVAPDGGSELDEALGLIRLLVEQAERVSLRGLRSAADGQAGVGRR